MSGHNANTILAKSKEQYRREKNISDPERLENELRRLPKVVLDDTVTACNNEDDPVSFENLQQVVDQGKRIAKVPYGSDGKFNCYEKATLKRVFDEFGITKDPLRNWFNPYEIDDLFTDDTYDGFNLTDS